MVECKWAQSLSWTWLWATLWTIARQAPLSMGFSRQEFWSGFPCSPSRGPSQTRDQTYVSCTSCTAGGSFTADLPGKTHGWVIQQNPMQPLKTLAWMYIYALGFSRDANWCLWKASDAIPVPGWTPRTRGTDAQETDAAAQAVNQREWILWLDDAHPHWGGQSALIYQLKC